MITWKWQTCVTSCNRQAQCGHSIPLRSIHPYTVRLQWYNPNLCLWFYKLSSISSIQGTYKLINGQSDYSVASRLPIDGNRWITYMKLFEEIAPQSQTAGKNMSSFTKAKRTQIWCLDSDVRITLSKTAVRQTRKHPTRGPGQTNS